MNLCKVLEARLAKAMAQAGAPAGCPSLVRPSGRPQFGDYQANGVMAAAKKLKTNPRELAEKVLAAADLTDLTEKVEVAGPGFINIHLKAEWLAQRLDAIAADDRLGVAQVPDPQTVVVDYSGPNLAKEMHVGHLRSTIIGDALARVLGFLGHDVKRQNHVGDWGTQFGMLIAYMDAIAGTSDSAYGADVPIGDLEEFYRNAKQHFDTDEAFAANAREHVVKLQSGDKHCRLRWEQFRDQSLDHCQHVYDDLGVLLHRSDVRAESEYNDDLPKVISDLDASGLLTESQGAQCVFLDEFKDNDGKVLPVIVQKTDGGYLYATTDLAAIRYRVGIVNADRILYVTDSRQSLHFKQIFAVARAAGFAPDNVSLEHVPFGTMMGPGGTPFKTREGGTVKLTDLLHQAVDRAGNLVKQKSPALSDGERFNIARAVGIGAVKYADLAHNRTSDYVFSWDKMLSLEGNTAPYMQYAYARVRSIFRKGDADDADLTGQIVLAEPAERTLAVRLLQLPETLDTVADQCLPNVLCAYLYDLAVAFSGFYENCPVLKAGAPVRTSRLLLCKLTASTISRGLSLLGIQTIEQM